MNQLQTKAYLEEKGWKCKPCSCTGAKSYDCLHESFRGTSIKLKPQVFRISKKGRLITSALYTQFEVKIKAHELDTQTA